MEEIITALIAAGATLVVCLINNAWTDQRRREEADADLEVLKATIKIEIASLTRQVEKHNEVIERVYSLENKADVFEEKLKVANHRIDDLERKEATANV